MVCLRRVGGGFRGRRQELEQEAKRAAEADSGPRRPLSRSSSGGRSLAVSAAVTRAVTAAAITEVEQDLGSSLQLLQNQVCRGDLLSSLAVKT